LEKKKIGLLEVDWIRLAQENYSTRGGFLFRNHISEISNIFAKLIISVADKEVVSRDTYVPKYSHMSYKNKEYQTESLSGLSVGCH
jgi:hypothetical protein